MTLYATTLVTEDLPRLRSFYEQLLGIQPMGNPIYCEFRTRGGMLALMSADAHPTRDVIGTSEKASVELSLTVPDVDAAYDRLQDVVPEWLEPPTKRFWGWRSAILRDPDGNIVSIGTPAPWGRNVEVADWSNNRLADVLRAQLDDAAWFVRNATDDLTDEEYFRELAPGSWSVRRKEDATTPMASGAGGWVIDYSMANPDPAPFTTIAWRLVHIGGDLWQTWDHAFGERKLTYENLPIPSTANDAVEWCNEGARRLIAAIADVTDDDLRKVLTPEGLTGYDALVRAIRETTHHAAEIACLRDVYRALGPA